MANKLTMEEFHAYALRPIPENSPEAMSKTVTTIRAMYDSGVPFYTKECLADLVQQIDDAKNGRQKIVLKGLNDKTEETVLETGKVVRLAPKTNMEYVFMPPEVVFSSYRQMLVESYERGFGAPWSAIGISQQIKVRYHDTKEPTEPDRPSASLSDTRNNFLRTQHLWRDSASYRQLELVLKQHIPPETDTVVAFALGSISNCDKRLSQRSLFQHALVLIIKNIVKTNNRRQEANCYLQDPIYNATDELVLNENGINVLENPRAFLEVNDSSVVISCCPNVSVKQIVADLARPAVVIWDYVAGEVPHPDRVQTDETSPRVEQMMRDYYEEVAFPWDRELFNNMAIYIRKVHNIQANNDL